MPRPFARCAPVCLLVALAAVPVRADIMWNEAVDGDLSGDGALPTPFVLGLGAHSLIATSVSGDREYIAVTIPAGLHLNGIIHATWTSTDSLAFIAVQSGSTFTEPFSNPNVANLMGWAHFGPGAGTVGTDILPGISTGAGASGFTPPLDEGTYAFWIQQTGASPATYQLDFTVIPAPGAGALAFASLALAARRRR